MSFVNQTQDDSKHNSVLFPEPTGTRDRNEMIKERRFTLTGPASFLLIVCWVMAIGVIRSSDASPVSSSAESETLAAIAGDADRQDEARVDEFLNAVEDLVGRLDDDTPVTSRHEQPDTWAVAKRGEEAPVSSGGVNRAAHAIGLHQRSALNKNFIRFGRSGGHNARRAIAIEKLSRYSF